MAVYQDREAFIPYSRRDLIELCIKDGKLPDASLQKFRDFVLFYSLITILNYIEY